MGGSGMIPGNSIVILVLLGKIHATNQQSLGL